MEKQLFFKRKLFYIPALLIVLIGGSVLVFKGNGDAKFETQVIELGVVTHIVNETGTIKAGKDISLSFARSGRVSKVLVAKGDIVNKGETLAILDNGSLNADLRQAQASLELERASVEKTGVEFENAKLSLNNALTDAYIKADDAVQAKADQLFTNPESSNPTFGVNITKGSIVFFVNTSVEQSIKINSLRTGVEKKLNELEKIIFSNSVKDVEQTALATESTLQDVQKLLSLIATPLNEYVADDTNVQTVYEGFKADISSARSSVNTTLTALRLALQSYYTAQASIETSYQGPSGNSISQAIKLREIRIEDAQARVDGIQSHINDGYIISPITGLITDVFINEGEIASAALEAISVISNSNLEISVDIPEDDIAFVDVGDKASITFDAYDNALFNAEVIFISPKAKLVDGVPVFEVTLEFIEKDVRIKAGFSVDVDIIAEEKTDTISVPSRSVIEKDGIKFIRVMVGNDSYRRHPVTLGLRGEDGVVEVKSGLEIGANIITFINDDVLNTLKEIE